MVFSSTGGKQMLKSALMVGVALTMVGMTPVLAQTTKSTTTTTNQASGSGVMAMTVDDLEDQKVYGADGKEIGEIDDVVRPSSANGTPGTTGSTTAGSTLFAVVQAGGNWLGMGSEKVLVPINQFSMEGDKLTLPMTDQQAKALQKWEDNDNDFAEVDEEQTLSEAQASQ
jgi:hypothetical protein